MAVTGTCSISSCRRSAIGAGDRYGGSLENRARLLLETIEASLLAGLVYDDAGERMTPTHANKKGTRYRYYVSHSLIRRGRPKGRDGGRRVPAADLEGLIEDRIVAFLGDQAAGFSAVESFIEDVTRRMAVAHEAAELARRWREIEPSGRRLMLQRLVDRIDVRRDAVDIAIRPNAIPAIVHCDLGPMRQDPGDEDTPTLILSVPARLKRTGMEIRLLIEGAGGGPRREPDRSLLRLLALAHRFHTMVVQDQGRSITELADDGGVSPSYFTRILRLSFLAPDIVKAILSGCQPPQLTAKHLMSQSRLAKNWPSQATQLGIT